MFVGGVRNIAFEPPTIHRQNQFRYGTNIYIGDGTCTRCVYVDPALRPLVHLTFVLREIQYFRRRGLAITTLMTVVLICFVDGGVIAVFR